MIYPFQARHSGLDRRNPGTMDGFELTIHGAGYLHPGGYDGLASQSDKVELIKSIFQFNIELLIWMSIA